ncbi:MAG: ferric iron uptake transcriptional regulator [Saezia sp.]
MIPSINTDNIDNLKNTGLKATLPRLKILEIFQANKENHLSAEDIFRILINQKSDIGLATVYRVLAQFEQAGLLRRSNFEAGKSVYELDEGKHHDHMVCLSCGKVEEFVDEKMEKRQIEIAQQHGFHLEEHSVAMYGTCADCMKQGKKA